LVKINAFNVEDVILVVSSYFELKSIQQITIRKGRVPEARRIAMYLASKHCRKKETLSSIAMKFGVKISGLNMARDKFTTRLKVDKKLRRTVTEIERKL
jgi:chromosomal replication initiation ATPase DnaA